MRNRPSAWFFLAFTGMELCYLYLLASLFEWPAYSLVLSLALYPITLLFKLAVTGSNTSRRLKITLEMVLVILVIILVAGERLSASQAAGRIDVSGIVLRMLFCGLIWLMGHTVPHRQVNYYHVAFRLQAGLVAVLILAQVVDSSPPVFIFYLLAPLAIFFARWASSFSRGANALNYPNLWQLFLAGAGVIVPGTALVLLFSPDVGRAIVKWLANISDSLSVWMMSQQHAAANQSGRFSLSCNVRPDTGGTGSPDFMTPGLSGGSSGISPIIIWIVVAVVFLLIVTLVFFIIRRRKTGRKSETAERAQFSIRKVSLITLRSFFSFFPRMLKKLWLWVQSLFKRFKRHPESSEEPLASIRGIYRSLLRWAAGKGTPRITTQTPLEHLELLVREFPEQKNGLRQVTEAYLLARYSRTPISPDEFFRIKRVWQETIASLTLSRDGGR